MDHDLEDDDPEPHLWAEVLVAFYLACALAGIGAVVWFVWVVVS